MLFFFFHRFYFLFFPLCVFFFNDTATTEIYTLSLHDALPIPARSWRSWPTSSSRRVARRRRRDRKSTRLNSSHDQSSYAVFCLKKKKITYPCPCPHKKPTPAYLPQHRMLPE